MNGTVAMLLVGILLLALVHVDCRRILRRRDKGPLGIDLQLERIARQLRRQERRP